jgi:flagellar protein FliL
MPLFMIADDTPLDESARDKALLDAEELADTDVSLDRDKVELDLDDAPFLEEEEEEEPAPADDLEEEEEEKEVRARGVKALLEAIRRDRRLMAAVIGGAVLLLGLLLTLLLWPSKEASPPVDPLELPPETAVPEEPPPPEHIVALKPFLVEHVTEEGEVRLLYCKFSVTTENEKLAWEITHKRLTLRDAIFYYLKNKDLRFLTDKTQVGQLKKDLLSVINQYLNVGQIETLLIEEYLVK